MTKPPTKPVDLPSTTKVTPQPAPKARKAALPKPPKKKQEPDKPREEMSPEELGRDDELNRAFRDRMAERDRNLSDEDLKMVVLYSTTFRETMSCEEYKGLAPEEKAAIHLLWRCEEARLFLENTLLPQLSRLKFHGIYGAASGRWAAESVEVARSHYHMLDTRDAASRRIWQVIKHLEDARTTIAFHANLQGTGFPSTSIRDQALTILGQAQATDPAGLGKIPLAEWERVIDAWRGFTRRRPGRPKGGSKAYDWADIVWELLQKHDLTQAASPENMADAYEISAWRARVHEGR